MATTTQTIIVPKKWVGQSIKRKEDLRLITGQGNFVDDLKLANMHYVALLRSPYAHAKIKKVDVSRATGRAGVLAVITGKDIAEMSNPMLPAPSIPIMHYCMATDKVRFVGEPVAAVVASSRYIAEDALEFVDVEYEPLQPVVTFEDAERNNAVLVHDSVGSNVAWQRFFSYGDVDQDFQSADQAITETFSVHRVSSTPIETFGVIASFDKISRSLSVYSNSQIPGLLHAILAQSLKIPQSRLRLVTSDIGGSYGVKLGLPYLILVSATAMKTGVPVKYVEDRREHLLGLQHGSETKYKVDAAIKNDGSIRSLKVRVVENVGAYPAFPEPEGMLEQLFTGGYRIKSYTVDYNLLMSNKCTTGPCRGYGRYNVAFMLERILDIVAKKLKMDPTEVRFKNFIQPGEFPYTAPNGNLYDSGNYPENLRKALAIFDYGRARIEQRKAKKAGRKIGIGVGFIVEIGTPNFAHFGLVSDKPPASLLSNNTEIATVSLDTSGRASVSTGMSPQGQGHETALAQAVADELGISPDEVYVNPGFDSNTHPFTGASGTYGSRFGGVGVSAAVSAARKVREKLLSIAGFMLGESIENLDVGNGLIYAKSNPQKAIPVQAVCGATYYHSLILPKNLEPSLTASSVYGISTATMPDAQGRMNNGLTYASSAHVAEVEVDRETGKVKVLRYVAVDDCGKQINPRLVEGQTQGAIAHALAWTLFEEINYGKDGELLSSTFIDYLVPSASDMPDFQIDRIETLSPFTILGTKGIGEGGSMPVMPLIATAIEDALELKEDQRFTYTHQSPEKVWALAKMAPT